MNLGQILRVGEQISVAPLLIFGSRRSSLPDRAAEREVLVRRAARYLLDREMPNSISRIWTTSRVESDNNELSFFRYLSSHLRWRRHHAPSLAPLFIARPARILFKKHYFADSALATRATSAVLECGRPDGRDDGQFSTCVVNAANLLLASLGARRRRCRLAQF